MFSSGRCVTNHHLDQSVHVTAIKRKKSICNCPGGTSELVSTSKIKNVVGWMLHSVNNKQITK